MTDEEGPNPKRLTKPPPVKPSQPVTPGTAGRVAPAGDLERLRAELREALERQAAVSEVLRTINSSAFDLQAVFSRVCERAARSCDAFSVALWLRVGDQFSYADSWPEDGELYENYSEHQRSHPFGLDSPGVIGRSYRAGKPVMIENVHADPDYPKEQLRYGQVGTLLGVPLMKDGVMVGGLSLTRRAVQLFSGHEIELVQTFADQAVIAIENVRLFNETREALEQQTATSEILKAISTSTSDLQPVFDAVVEHAARLCDADRATVNLRRGALYHVVASRNLSGSSLGGPAGVSIDRGTPSGRVYLEGRTLLWDDILADPDMGAEAKARHRDSGTRSMLAVPIKGADDTIGTIVLRRNAIRPFSSRQVGLVETFADQAAIAIENVRLFNETKEQSRQLETVNQELAAASKHKSEFLANMSHELRTPLNAVIGFSEVLLQKMFGELNEQQTDYVRDISSSGRHLLDLVNEILDLSKIEAGRMELESSEFDLGNTISGAVMFVRERAVRHSIELASEVPDDLGTVVADERKVRQVLLNLLSNAVKFTPDGGAIGVCARRGDGAVEVSVRDTGIGIAPEDQPRVFEEFQQVGRPSDRSREGTGLGLALAKRFVELHGGRMWLDSEVGKGTTFTFTVPTNTRPGTSS